MIDPLHAGEQEKFKMAVHLGLFGLAVTVSLYNLGAWLARRERHLAANTVIYAALLGWEVDQIYRHAKAL
jgi:putative effector of murein hydrolase